MPCSLTTTPYNLSGTGVCNNASAAYPNAFLIDSFSYNRNLAILGFSLSSSFSVDSAAITTFGILLVFNTAAASISIGQNTGILTAHGALANTIIGTSLNPSNQVSNVFFDDYGLKLEAGQSVSLYYFGFNAASAYQAMATIFTIPVK